ncbi:MAG: hypothetical protein KQI62_13375 [Deltaproteobacteria bacterium]|nr:hypothetical protein [Deltaproteobacteria bacterium]
MAEVKSALEIALERAAALGAGEDDSKRQAQKKGQALARQCLEGDLSAKDMAGQLAGLGPESTASAAEALLEALEQERPGAMAALEAICSGGPPGVAYEALTQAQARLEAARQRLDSELAQVMLTDLAAKGIGGSAVHPNPAAHPEYEARCAAALAEAQAELKAAGEKLLEALA